MYCYHNENLLKDKDISISFDDFGFQRGNTVFELLRVYSGKPYMLDDHINRLFRSLEICFLQIAYAKDDVKSKILSLISKNSLKDSVVKIYVTQGYIESPAWSLAVNGNFEPQVYIIEKEFTPYSDKFPAHEKYYLEGMSLACVEAERSLPEAKTINYAVAVVESSKLINQGYEDIIYISRNDYVTECSRSNIFFVKDGVVMTPKSGMLEGVTRKSVLSICIKNKIPYKVQDIKRDDIYLMDEVFMTGSTIELMPVCCVDDKKWDVKTFKVYKKLFDLFKEEILV